MNRKIIKLMDDSDPSFWGNGSKKKSISHSSIEHKEKKVQHHITITTKL